MNLYIKKLSFLILSLALIFTACETEESIEITSPDPALILQQPGISNVFLNFGTPTNAAITISWNDDLTGSSSYNVEMALDAEFTSPVNLGSVTKKTYSISVEALNTALKNAGATNFRDIAVYFRIKAGSVTSNAIQYLVTRYPVDPPVISSPTANQAIVLSLSTLDAIALTVTWSDAVLQSTLGVNVDYTVQAAKSGTSFAAPVSLGTKTNGTTITSKHSDLNAVALGIGLTPAVVGNMDIRIISKITNENGNILTRTSSVVTIKVTPYNVSFPNLFLVGDAIPGNGWTNNSASPQLNPPLFRDQNVPNAYVYIGNFNAGGFKFIQRLGQWQPQWGTNGGSTIAENPGGGSDPGTFNVATAGYYQYNFTTVNGAGSYSVTAYNASSAPTYGTMGIIGAAIGGWGDADEINFTKHPNIPHLWYAFGVNFINGQEFLIRANDGWSSVWRHTGSTQLYGKSLLAGSGNNFPFSAPSGRYNVWFNDLDGSYVIIPN